MKRIKGSIRIMFVNSYLLTERAKANRLEEKENQKGFFFTPQTNTRQSYDKNKQKYFRNKMVHEGSSQQERRIFTENFSLPIYFGREDETERGGDDCILQQKGCGRRRGEKRGKRDGEQERQAFLGGRKCVCVCVFLPKECVLRSVF